MPPTTNKTTVEYAVSPDKKIVTVYSIDTNGMVIGNPMVYTIQSVQAQIKNLQSQIAGIQSRIDTLNSSVVPLFS